MYDKIIVVLGRIMTTYLNTLLLGHYQSVQ